MPQTLSTILLFAIVLSRLRSRGTAKRRAIKSCFGDLKVALLDGSEIAQPLQPNDPQTKRLRAENFGSTHTPYEQSSFDALPGDRFAGEAVTSALSVVLPKLAGEKASTNANRSV